MKIQIRDEHGGEIGIEAPLSEKQYATVLRVCLDLVKEHAESVRNQPAPRSGT